MALSLLNSKYPLFASKGKTEAIHLEKYEQGYTGLSSDYAYATQFNYLMQKVDERFNLTNSLVNLSVVRSIMPFNMLFEYPKDSVVIFNNKIYRAKIPTTAKAPTDELGDDTWELVIQHNFLNDKLNLKANLESPALTGIPTTPDPSENNLQQIENYGHTLSLIKDRVTGKSVLDLSPYESNKAIPVILCKGNKPTKSIISRVKEESGDSYGNMHLFIEGIGNGKDSKNVNYLKIINMTDTSNAEIRHLVKKIELREGNPYIIVWLRGGTIYNIDQRYPEEPPEILIQQQTFENNWVINVEAWVDNEYLNDGVWEYKKQNDITLNYTSTSDTGAVETCGTLVMTFNNQRPLGSLVADGSAISRVTYSKLFQVIGVRYGAGDGITTFNLPDMRGLVPRGLDLGKGIDSNQLITPPADGTGDRTDKNAVGSIQTDAIRNITGRFGWDGYGVFGTATEAFYLSGSGLTWSKGQYWGNNMIFDASRVVPTATKNQVDNMALLACIYYI